MKTSNVILIGILSLLSIGGVLYLQKYPYTTSRSMCINCRAIATTTTRSTSEHTEIVTVEFSAWFNRKFGPHEHKWGWSGSEATYSGVSLTRGCGNPNPIWALSEEVQRDFYEKGTASDVAVFWSILGGQDQELKDTFVNRIMTEFLDYNLKK